jgi:hypothetical protein
MKAECLNSEGDTHNPVGPQKIGSLASNEFFERTCSSDNPGDGLLDDRCGRIPVSSGLWRPASGEGSGERTSVRKLGSASRREG